MLSVYYTIDMVRTPPPKENQANKNNRKRKYINMYMHRPLEELDISSAG